MKSTITFRTNQKRHKQLPAHMTLTECLRKTVIVWSYLAKNPWKTKQEAYEARNLTPDIYCCACCEYCLIEREDAHPDCSRCPMKYRWHVAKQDDGAEMDWPDNFCMDLGTHYTNWRHTEIEAVRISSALAIAKAAADELYLNTVQGDKTKC